MTSRGERPSDGDDGGRGVGSVPSSTGGGVVMRQKKEQAPWVPSWKHHGWQGLKEFGERQAARLAAVKQRRVKA